MSEIKLKIPQKIHNKYTYLLNRFVSLEWSGPAWYKYKTDKDGYPTEFKILHFHPLNLGSSAATEFTAEDFAKIMAETYDNYPSLKTASIGLIHSHNTMGAFLSPTDTDTIEDMAPPEGFYPSLVVAKSGKALHAFGFGYQDQYKVQHCVEIDKDNISILVPKKDTPEEWIAEADHIEKNKPVPKPGKQTTMWDGKNKNATDWAQAERKKKAILSKKPLAIQNKINKLIDKNSEGKLSDVDLEAKLENLGLDVTEIMWLTGDMDYSSYSVYGGYGYGLY